MKSGTKEEKKSIFGSISFKILRKCIDMYPTSVLSTIFLPKHANIFSKCFKNCNKNSRNLEICFAIIVSSGTKIKPKGNNGNSWFRAYSWLDVRRRKKLQKVHFNIKRWYLANYWVSENGGMETIFLSLVGNAEIHTYLCNLCKSLHFQPHVLKTPYAIWRMTKL